MPSEAFEKFQAAAIAAGSNNDQDRNAKHPRTEAVPKPTVFFLADIFIDFTKNVRHACLVPAFTLVVRQAGRTVPLYEWRTLSI